MLTIPTDEPWVPLRILGLGIDSTKVVNADVFLLTDARPDILTADPGVDIERSEFASSSLLADLRSDKHMEWVPDSMWFSYVRVGSRAGDLQHDISVSTKTGTLPSAHWAGFATRAPGDGGFVWWPLVLLVAAPFLLVVGGLALRRRAEA